MSGELVAAQNRANDSDAKATQLRFDNEKLEHEKNLLKEHKTWLDQELEKKTIELQKQRQQHYEAVSHTSRTLTRAQTCARSVHSYNHKHHTKIFFEHTADHAPLMHTLTAC